jgi:hypothetical protein
LHRAFGERLTALNTEWIIVFDELVALDPRTIAIKATLDQGRQRLASFYAGVDYAVMQGDLLIDTV